jgi:hypothetical protein
MNLAPLFLHAEAFGFGSRFLIVLNAVFKGWSLRPHLVPQLLLHRLKLLNWGWQVIENRQPDTATWNHLTHQYPRLFMHLLTQNLPLQYLHWGNRTDIIILIRMLEEEGAISLHHLFKLVSQIRIEAGTKSLLSRTRFGIKQQSMSHLGLHHSPSIVPLTQRVPIGELAFRPA